MRLWGRAPMGAVAQAGQRTSEFRKAGSSAPQRGCREPKLILVSVLLRRSSRGHLSVQVQSCSHFRVQQSRAGRGRGGRACLKCSLWSLAQPVLLVWTVCRWDPVICILITILSLFPGLLRPMTCLPGSSKQWKFVLSQFRTLKSTLSLPGLKSRCRQGWTLLEGCRGESVPGRFQLLGMAAFLGLWRHPSNLCLCLHTASPPLSFLSLPFSYKDTRDYIRACPNCPGYSRISRSLISSHLDVFRGDHSAYPPSHALTDSSVEGPGSLRRNPSLKICLSN